MVRTRVPSSLPWLREVTFRHSFNVGLLSSVLAFQGSKKFAKDDFVSSTFMRIVEAVNISAVSILKLQLNTAEQSLPYLVG